MTIILYHSTLISDRASEKEAVATTSSHIFLSRGVAGAASDLLTLPHSDSPTFVTSIYESDSTHIMALGDAATQSTITGLDGAKIIGNPDEESEMILERRRML